MLEFYKTEIKPLNDRLAEMINNKKDVKHITVYEQMKGPNGIVLNIPIKKVKSMQALGLSLRGQNE